MQLVVDAAIVDNDLATFSVAVQRAARLQGQPGWNGVDLDRVEIPEQAEALQAIAACESINVVIQQQWTIAAGRRRRASKLTAARAQVALEQSRRTTAPGSTLHS